MPSLACEGVWKSFEGREVLRGASIAFPLQGIVGLVGPNGAGKSTLLNVISGFVRPELGKVRVGGRDVTSLAPYERAELGLFRSFQSSRLIGRFRVLEHLQFAAGRGRRETLLRNLGQMARSTERAELEECAQVLEVVGLSHLADHFVGALSFGQRKILGIALAMASRADVLLLDEPVSGVHQEVVERISSLLTRVSKGGRLVVVVEHDLEMVRATAGEVVVMNNGEVIAVGPTMEVLASDDVLEAYVS